MPVFDNVHYNRRQVCGKTLRTQSQAGWPFMLPYDYSETALNCCAAVCATQKMHHVPCPAREPLPMLALRGQPPRITMPDLLDGAWLSR
ncbi:hypothetical protein NB694_001726 [Pantoea ananatis]|jgi:hypothetical protein|nr:hypothetical protein [Pantoea ananatis]MCW0330800.1 hypothetical protein [Pantoea ananatis]